MEFCLAFLCRWRDKNQIVPHIVALSIHNWLNGTQNEPWQVWQRMRWLYCKDWTLKFLKEMSELMPPPRHRVSRAVYCEGADNDFVLVRLGIQRVGASHTNVDMIQRVQFAPLASDASDALVDKPQSQRMQSPYVRPANFEGLFQDFDPVLCMLGTELIAAVATDLGSAAPNTRTRVTERPHGVAGLKSWKKILRPMAGTSASNGSHVGRYMNNMRSSEPE